MFCTSISKVLKYLHFQINSYHFIPITIRKPSSLKPFMILPSYSRDENVKCSRESDRIRRICDGVEAESRRNCCLVVVRCFECWNRRVSINQSEDIWNLFRWRIWIIWTIPKLFIVNKIGHSPSITQQSDGFNLVSFWWSESDQNWV